MNQLTDQDNQAEKNVLKEALKPFASLYQEHLFRKQDDHPVFAINDALITVGDLRKAVELLK